MAYFKLIASQIASLYASYYIVIALYMQCNGILHAYMLKMRCLATNPGTQASLDVRSEQAICRIRLDRVHYIAEPELTRSEKFPVGLGRVLV
jgi:hypothetical protein